ncbi:hypothetical protein RRG08_057011 [Elysia crispata]|uniref:Uncharacterized protein n=1 Tax=Elysia crispata TaxID=231223 RepID=A0AAE1DBQ5_9GAST|nr:hypothetical protein RRG08_057011 [Elysia crispata]
MLVLFTVLEVNSAAQRQEVLNPCLHISKASIPAALGIPITVQSTSRPSVPQSTERIGVTINGSHFRYDMHRARHQHSLVHEITLVQLPPTTLCVTLFSSASLKNIHPDCLHRAQPDANISFLDRAAPCQPSSMNSSSILLQSDYHKHSWTRCCYYWAVRGRQLLGSPAINYSGQGH